MLTTTYQPNRPLDLQLTLAPLGRGRGDPTMRFAADGVWRASRTPDGPATIHLRGCPGGTIVARAWGPGAGWAIDGVPDLLGAADDDRSFAPAHPVVRRLHHDLPGLRITRSRGLYDALFRVVLEQRVMGSEAARSFRGLVRRYGERAPGPVAGLRLVPPPATLAALPYSAFHPLGVERRRAETLRRVAASAASLDRAADPTLGAAEATAILRSVPGVGAWTAAEVALVALGDADAVSVGDFHLPNQVAWALAGEPRADDERMLELLAPFAGHRGRVIRLLGAGGISAPRRGPRLATPWWRPRSA